MSRTARRLSTPLRQINFVAKSLRGGLVALFKMLMRLRLLWFMLLAALLLSGCVQSEVGLNFSSQTHGEIVQHIKLNEQLVGFSGSAVQEWLKSAERRARKLQGHSKRLSPQEILVTIPFNNGKDLETKFNQFFNPSPKQIAKLTAATGVELPSLESHFSLKENNALFAIRSRFSYDLDLRSLALISTEDNPLVNPSALVSFEFSLQTPWGARSIETTDRALHPERHQNQLIWTLQPGQQNHIEAIFWLPSPVGMGSLFIVAFMTLGWFLRHQLLPKLGLFPAQDP